MPRRLGSMMSFLLWAAAASSQTLEGMDVFGVAPKSIAELERCFGSAAREIVATAKGGNRTRALELEEALEQRIREAGGFEAVDIAIVHYLDPDERVFLTFDVTRRGQAEGIRFRPQPCEEVPDPDGLLASWKEYEKAGSTVGFDDRPGLPPCPAYHCVYGFDHPKLRPFARIFGRKVPARRDELVNVLLKDKDARERSAAAFLLAHLPRARTVVKALLPGIYDPDPSVRNNVLRVFAFMADQGATASIPPEPFLPFLASPSLTDRNKAVAIVAALSAEKRHHSLLLDRAACDLVRLLEMKQPNQSEFAHTALVRLRGSDLGASDPAAWKDWLKQHKGKVCPTAPEIGTGDLCPSPVDSC